MKCNLCPRNCDIDRNSKQGYCGGGSKIKIARAMLHKWEEPSISGENGSGAIFFSGCPLKCVFCQNFDISTDNFGAEISVARLVEIFFELEKQSAHNINLVSPSQYVSEIIQALKIAKPLLKIPVVYNTSAYEKIETLKKLEGLVDVYLPDLKYKNSDISFEYSKAKDYFEFASKAILEMFRQTGKYKIDENGIIQKGIIIRHLVLPGTRQDSKDIIDWIAENFCKDDILISIMSQYTPEFYKGENKNLKRKLTSFEYSQVIDKLIEHGFDGYMQEKTSAKSDYTPSFDLQGVEREELPIVGNLRDF